VTLKEGRLTDDERAEIEDGCKYLLARVADVAESFSRRMDLGHASSRALFSELVLLTISAIAETHVKTINVLDGSLGERLKG